MLSLIVSLLTGTCCDLDRVFTSYALITANKFSILYLFNNQELLLQVIMYFILVTLMFD